MFRRIFLFSAVLLSFFEGYTQQSITDKFQVQLDSVFSDNPEAVGAIIHLEYPEKGISWSYAVGMDGKEPGKQLSAEQPVLIASNTKTYVAASTLRLVEMNKIEMNQSIADLLTKKTTRRFRKAGYDLESITIKQLLSHTSGIRDYVDDAYFEWIGENPQYKWTRNKQIKRSMELGGPLTSTGNEFAYGDINYLLLTEILEQQTGDSFYEAIPELLKFDSLNISHTWFEGLQDAPEKTEAMAHQYASKYNWDSYELNPSWDLYGGGGIAATAKDAALFYQHLFEGGIIKESALLDSMVTYVLSPETSKYCLGLFHFDFVTPLYYHGGWWGTDVAYSPEANATITMFTLEKSKRGEFAKLSREILESLVLEENESTNDE
jgi:D-alanyl-D-alanine carboxypeptidase